MPESSIDALDLAALLCSRVCHDLISPVGAIVNGLEVYEEDKDEETKNFRDGTDQEERQNRFRRLQFCRLAFGAAGSAGAQIDLGDAETMARAFIEDDKVKLAWNLPRAAVGEKSGQAPAQYADHRRPGYPARRQLDGRSDGRGREPWPSRSPRPASMPSSRRRCRRCWRARPAPKRSTPMAFSRSIPACWPGACGLAATMATEGDAVVVQRETRRLLGQLTVALCGQLPALSATKIKRFIDTLTRLRESGRRSGRARRKALAMDDLLREFLTETNEALDMLDVELVRFEQDPNNAAILDNIFRLVHTIKGTCGFLSLPRLESLAHAAETLMGQFRNGMPVTGEAVTLILVTIDRIKALLEALEAAPARAGRLRLRSHRRTRAHGRARRAVAPSPAGAASAETLASRPGECARRARARVPRHAGRSARRETGGAVAPTARRETTTTARPAIRRSASISIRSIN